MLQCLKDMSDKLTHHPGEKLGALYFYSQGGKKSLSQSCAFEKYLFKVNDIVHERKTINFGNILFLRQC